MDYLQLQDKTVLVVGVANRKSVAYHVARLLTDAGARVVYVVRNEEIKQRVAKLVRGLGHDADDEQAADPPAIYLCDVEREEDVARLREELAKNHPVLHGMVHSIAFADYEGGVKPFHETGKEQFLRAMDVSSFSLVTLSNALKDLFDEQASVVTISISTTRMASENYGFMAPIKAALDSSLAFLAKSFSRFSKVRFNAVAPGLLKTSASAGIPGYVDAYLFAEQVIPRGQAVQTEEVANTVAFLLSPRSSGINAQNIIIDAGMSINYFDAEIVRRVVDGK